MFSQWSSTYAAFHNPSFSLFLSRYFPPAQPPANRIWLQAYLARRYPVRHVEDHSSIPTCDYQWPNGQGDKAKFMEGQKNSESWERQFGAIYRLWSGMAPEVYRQPSHLFSSLQPY